MNAADKVNLDSIVSRVADLEMQKKEIGEEIQELCKQAKDDLGRSAKVIKQLAKEKNWNEIERMEQRLLEDELDECRGALGLLADTPLGEHAQARAATKTVRKSSSVSMAGAA